MVDYAADFRFVLQQNESFTSEMRRSLSPLEAITTMLPHPSGTGSMACHPAAHRRLFEMADGALSRSAHAGRVEVDSVFRSLKEITVTRFYKEERDPTTSEADRAVAAAVKAAAKSCRTLTHFFPCHIGDDKGEFEFSIGGVRFRRTTAVLEGLKSGTEAYLDESDEPSKRQLAEHLAADAQGYYGTFGWTAEITIENCDDATSRRRAERAVQAALDALHVLLGIAHSDNMRLGGANIRTDRRSHIIQDAAGEVDFSSSADWLTNSLGDDWWEILNDRIGDDLLPLMSLALDGAMALPMPRPLAQRFVDGATWFGEACRDRFRASRLVKYVTAMERILVTPDADIAETIARRGASLLCRSLPDYDDFDRLKQRIKDVYDMRSRIVHGARSPHDMLGVALRDAEELARFTLVQIVRFYGPEGLTAEQFSDKRLNEVFADHIRVVERDQASRLPPKEETDEKTDANQPT